jgi:hypothetical protein
MIRRVLFTARVMVLVHGLLLFALVLGGVDTALMLLRFLVMMLEYEERKANFDD